MDAFHLFKRRPRGQPAAGCWVSPAQAPAGGHQWLDPHRGSQHTSILNRDSRGSYCTWRWGRQGQMHRNWSSSCRVSTKHLFARGGQQCSAQQPRSAPLSSAMALRALPCSIGPVYRIRQRLPGGRRRRPPYWGLCAHPTRETLGQPAATHTRSVDPPGRAAWLPL